MPEENNSNFITQLFFQNPELLIVLVELLKLDEKETMSLHKWMCNKKVRISNCEICRPMTKEESVIACDNLVKFLYVKLFKCIVFFINESFKTDKDYNSISIVDFVGFERSDNDAFVQFCINYAQEKIQQFSVDSIFKSKQDDCINEGIDWVYIDFADNQITIDYIEKPLSIIEMIISESKVR